MPTISISTAGNLNDFNSALENIKTSSRGKGGGRKFIAEGKQYTLNQLTHQFISLLKKTELNEKNVSCYNSIIQQLNKLSKDETHLQDMGKAGRINLRMRSLFGNLIAKVKYGPTFSRENLPEQVASYYIKHFIQEKKNYLDAKLSVPLRRGNGNYQKEINELMQLTGDVQKGIDELIEAFHGDAKKIMNGSIGRKHKDFLKEITLRSIEFRLKAKRDLEPEEVDWESPAELERQHVIVRHIHHEPTPWVHRPRPPHRIHAHHRQPPPPYGPPRKAHRPGPPPPKPPAPGHRRGPPPPPPFGHAPRRTGPPPPHRK